MRQYLDEIRQPRTVLADISRLKHVKDDGPKRLSKAAQRALKRALKRAPGTDFCISIDLALRLRVNTASTAE